MALLAVVLLAVITFTYLTCLFTALRNMRLVSGMELASSMIFAVVGITLMRFWQCSTASVVVAYGAGNLLTSLGALWWLRRALHAVPEPSVPQQRENLWSRLLPFAAWLVITNLLTGLFDLIDRFMIMHNSHFSWAVAQAEVGNYRTSRVMPLLLASVTGMIAAVATPHLSHDWEGGHRDRVSTQLNLMLKVLAAVLTAGAVVMLAARRCSSKSPFAENTPAGLPSCPGHWSIAPGSD